MSTVVVTATAVISTRLAIPDLQRVRDAGAISHSVYGKVRFMVPNRTRLARRRPRSLTPTHANFVWSYDFVFDACANGQQLKYLTVVDEFTQECLAIDVGGSIRSRRVIEVLSRLISVHGAPRYLRSDNGPEFVSRAILQWLAEARQALEVWRKHYNESRPHSSLKDLSPDEFARTIKALEPA
jgi:putative transposase